MVQLAASGRELGLEGAVRTGDSTEPRAPQSLYESRTD